MRIKVGPFALVKANNSARACLTEMARLGEPKCLYGDKLVRLGGWPYDRKRVNRLGGVSHANSSSRMKGNVSKVGSPRRVARVGERSF